MTPCRHGRSTKQSDRIAALAEATQGYAEGLEDPDVANVYWGKSLGLWQAFEMLVAEERLRSVRHERGRPGRNRPRRGPGPPAAAG